MRSPITTCAFVLPILCLFIGVRHALVTPIATNDWLGMAFWGRVFYSILVASIVLVVFSVWAFGRKEKAATKTLIFSIPAFIFITWAGFQYVQVNIQNEKRRDEDEKWKYHAERLSSEKELLHKEFWPKDSSPRGRAVIEVLQDKTNNFDEVDLQALYDQDSTWIDFICRHPKCPENLLRSRFLHYTESSKRPSSIGGTFLRILAHTNSPLEFIEEVSKWEDLSDTDRWQLDRVLKGKLKKLNEVNTLEVDN